MAANYKREIKELDGCGMDVAFVPLDGRLENAYYWGMKYFLEHVPVKAVFPMHCWDHYEICQKVPGRAFYAGTPGTFSSH